ncbi:hypothetical protein NC652_033003 [Populus alba x Populus x berolinensis]|uniref:Uncharacterized protein n=1 Tax=Populus alba x Populus x berolinensis TaxID=444605 RepID=A0AAD6LSW5_9ROSI|nr:hypothetical protein NC652_033003 [Populus alba x Populus x berolinensis]KAJ6972505.1 hypothetical protein NC653_032944 [Populus alba x Populus x berolinensis]
MHLLAVAATRVQFKSAGFKTERPIFPSSLPRFSPPGFTETTTHGNSL